MLVSNDTHLLLYAYVGTSLKNYLMVGYITVLHITIFQKFYHLLITFRQSLVLAVDMFTLCLQLEGSDLISGNSYVPIYKDNYETRI